MSLSKTQKPPPPLFKSIFLLLFIQYLQVSLCNFQELFSCLFCLILNNLQKTALLFKRQPVKINRSPSKQRGFDLCSHHSRSSLLCFLSNKAEMLRTSCLSFSLMLQDSLCIEPMLLMTVRHISFLSLCAIQRDALHVFGKHPCCSLAGLNYR